MFPPRHDYDRYYQHESIDYMQEKRRARSRYRRSNVPYRGNYSAVNEESF